MTFNSTAECKTKMNRNAKLNSYCMKLNLIRLETVRAIIVGQL